MDGNTPNYSRRITWLAAFIVALFAAYSAGWYYLAGRLVDSTKKEIASANRNNVRVECENPVARGYPFRLGIYCDRVAYEDISRRLGLTAGNLRTAGQIYDPSHFIAELEGPATIDTPESGLVNLDWDQLRASVRWAKPLPERVSLESGNLSATTAQGSPLATIEAFETHLRPNGNDLDLATSFAGLLVDASLADNRIMPAFAGNYDLTIIDGVDLRGVQPRDLRGRSVTITDASLNIGPTGGLTVKGTFSVADDGLINADLKLTLRDPQSLSAVLTEMFPEKRRDIRNVSSALGFMGSDPTLPLTIERGEARIAFFKLGKLPPL